MTLVSGPSSQSSDSGFSQDSQESEVISSQAYESCLESAAVVEPMAISEVEVTDKATAYGQLAQAPVSSHSSDSGFSQDSQEMASVPSSQATTVDSDAYDEGVEDDVRPIMFNERPKDLNLNSDVTRKRKMSATDDFENSNFLTKRRDELPPMLQSHKNVFSVTSVMLTPDTDSNTPSTSSSVTSTPSFICTMCCVRPKDACFIHGQISHQVCCYPCAKMIFKNKGTCPVCRRRIEKITKNIVV